MILMLYGAIMSKSNGKMLYSVICFHAIFNAGDLSAHLNGVH